MSKSTKYHPLEWHTSNQTNYKQSESERTRSERLRFECTRLCNEAEQTTVCIQKEVEHRLSQRIEDIQFWKQEIEYKIKEVADEIEKILTSKIDLEKGLEATNFPLEVAKKCLFFREKRQAIDLVHDEVEIQLMKEVEVIEGSQCMLQKTHEETVEQLRLLKSYKYKLQKDLKDKFGALSIDDKCASLSDTTPNLVYSPGAVQVQANSILPEEWRNISDFNICKAEQERITSTTLRGVIISHLEQTKQDIIKQRQIVNTAFYKRIQEITDAKTTLENHLKEVIKEINSQGQNIASLQQAIHDKTGPMQLSHTRLDLRSNRPNNELVRDPAQYELVSEVKEIEVAVQKLQEHYLQSQAILKQLNRNELILREDIAIKTASLAIDENQCMELRKQLDIS